MTRRACLGRCLWLGGLLLLITSCEYFGGYRDPVGNFLAPLGFDKKLERQRKALTETELQTLLMEFSDTYLESMGFVFDKVYQQTSDTQLRASLVSNKVFYISASTMIAADSAPLKGLMDMMVMLSLQHDTWNLPVMRAQYGAGAAELASRLAWHEKQVWDIGAHVFPTDALEILRKLIAKWREQNPQQTYVAYTRFLHLPATAEKTVLQKYLQGTFLLKSVDQAVRSVDQARRTTERAIFVAERFPIFMVLHSQLAYLSISAEPQVQHMLGLADELTSTSKSFVRELDELPGNIQNERRELLVELAELVNQQRYETLTRFASIMDQQRSALFNDFDQRQATLHGSFADASHTLERASQLLVKFDETARGCVPLLQQTERLGEQYRQLTVSLADLTKTLRGSSGSTSSSLDLASLTQVLQELQSSAQEVNGMVLNLNKVVGGPDMKTNLQAMSVATQAQVDHLFHRTIVIMIVFFTGLTVSLTIPRLLARRRAGDLPS